MRSLVVVVRDLRFALSSVGTFSKVAAIEVFSCPPPVYGSFYSLSTYWPPWFSGDINTRETFRLRRGQCRGKSPPEDAKPWGGCGPLVSASSLASSFLGWWRLLITGASCPYRRNQRLWNRRLFTAYATFPTRSTRSLALPFRQARSRSQTSVFSHPQRRRTLGFHHHARYG